MNAWKIVVPSEDYCNEIITTTNDAYDYNERHRYKVRAWKEIKRGGLGWIEELKDDWRKMWMANGIGAEKALCKMLGLPYNFGMGKYRSNDLPILNGIVVDNKNSFGRWASINVNKEAVDLKIEHKKELPNVFSLVTGTLKTKYYGIGFIYFDDIVNEEHFVSERTDEETGIVYPEHYKAKQSELWWVDENLERIPIYEQIGMFA